MLGLPKNLSEHFKECVAAHLNIHSDSDSDSDSGQSSFDEDYYNLKPPPIPLDHFEKLTIIDDLAKSVEPAVPKHYEKKSDINSSIISQQTLTDAVFQETKISTDSKKLYSEILKNTKPKKSQLCVQRVDEQCENSRQSTSESVEKNVSSTNINDKLSWNTRTVDARFVENIVLLQKDEEVKSAILYSHVLKSMPAKTLVSVNTTKSRKFKSKNIGKPSLGPKNNKNAISTNNKMEGRKTASSCANNKLLAKKRKKKKIEKQMNNDMCADLAQGGGLYRIPY